MGVQQASRHWVVLRENLDFFLRYDYGPNAAAVPSRLTWGSREQNREEKQSKDQHFDTFELLADAYWMHRARGHQWFQTASPFQTHAAIPGKSRTRRRTLKASLKRRKYQNLKAKAIARPRRRGPDGASEKVRGAARRPTRHNLGSFYFLFHSSSAWRRRGAKKRLADVPRHPLFLSRKLSGLAASERLCQVSEHREN